MKLCWEKGPPQQAAMAGGHQSRAQGSVGPGLTTCSWLPSLGVVPRLLCPPTRRCLGDLLRVQLYGSGVEPTGKMLHSWDLCGTWLGQDLHAWQRWVQEQGARPSITSGRRHLSQRAKLCTALEPLKGLAGLFGAWFCLSSAFFPAV